MNRLVRDRKSQPLEGIGLSVTSLVMMAGVGLPCVCLLVGCSGKPAEVRGEPESRTSGLVCSEPEWDIGDVLVKGKSIDIKHAFRLENRSRRTIKIQEVQSDCGCLVAKGYTTTIEPGNATDINVTISVFGPPGSFRKTIVVKEDSGETLPLTVVGSRSLSDLLYSTPPAINFGAMTPNESKTKQLVLSRFNGSAVNFLALDAQDDRLSLDRDPVSYTIVDPMKKNVNCVEVPVRLDLKSHPVGPFKSKVTVRTDSCDASTALLDVEIEATIIEEETPWVPSILINRLKLGETAYRPLMDQQGESVGRAEIVSSSYEGDESIRVEVVHASANAKSASGPMVRISRQTDAKASGLARGTLTIRTRGAVAKIAIAVFLPR